VLRQVDAETGAPLVDVILDQAGAKGTGGWTVQTAIDLGVPVSGIAEAVFARSLSSHPEQRSISGALPGPDDSTASTSPAPTPTPSSSRCAWPSTRRRSSPTRRASTRSAPARHYDWSIDLGAVSKIWRAGCIIRAQFLNRIADAYEPSRTCRSADGAVLRRRAHPRAGRVAQHRRPGCGIRHPRSRLLVVAGVLRRAARRRLPAALIQGQRDFFGAHTYKRIDKDGTFHTLWSGDRTEVEAEDTH
jgi:6-phosphogluconate dehydrogenase